MDILGRRDTDDPEEPDAAPRLTAVYERVRRFVDRLSAIGSRLPPATGSTAATRDSIVATRVDGSSLDADRSPTECPSIGGFPDREYPLTYPSRELVGVNSPDVVSVETEHGLRLSMPENADASLTSDVWTTVEP